MGKIIKSSKKIRRKKIFVTFSAILCFVLFFYVLLGRLSQIDKFLIKQIEITGNSHIKKSEIFAIVSGELSGWSLYLYPRNNILLYPKNVIEKKLKNRYLRLDNVAFEIENLNKLKVVINERSPSFVWCPITKNDCYYLDIDGLVFDRAPAFSEGVFFRFQGGLKSKERADSYLGKNLIGAQKLDKLIKLKDEAVSIIRKNLGGQWSASHIDIMEWDDFSVRITDQKNKEWKILFVGRGIDPLSNLAEANASILKSKGQDETLSLETNLISIARNLEATVLSENFKLNYDKKDSAIDYIDLRFGKKVFYKFKTTN